MATKLDVVEYETRVVDSSLLVRDGRIRVHPEAQSSGGVGVRFLKDQLELKAGGVIGVIAVNDDVLLEVRTRVPVARIEEIVRRSGSSAFVPLPYDRGYIPSTQEFVSVDDLIADKFRALLAELALEGLYKTYSQVTGRGSSPRGRILAARTFVRLRTSLRPEAHYQHFGRTIDNAPNRLIHAAGRSLVNDLEHKRGRPTTLSLALRSQLEMFQGVADIDLKSGIEIGYLPANRPLLEQAVELSKLILFKRGVRFFGEGNVHLPSFLINMEKVFEEYARAALQKNPALASVCVLDGNKKPPEGAAGQVFEVAGSLGNQAANPDIVLMRDGAPVCVIDAKYKPCVGRPDRSNLEQVIVYAASYKAPVALLLFPCTEGQNTEIQFLGTIRDIDCYKATLQLMNDDLDAEEQALGELLSAVVEGH